MRTLEAEPATRARPVSAAKATIGRAARFIGHECRAAARRDGLDRGTRDRPLLQAAHCHPIRIRINRPPPRPVGGADKTLAALAASTLPGCSAHTTAMLNLRILAPNRLTDDVVQILEEDPCVSGLAVVRAAAIRPAGDLVFA